MTGFWIRPSLNKYSLTCRVTSCYILYYTYSEPYLLSKIQKYSGIFTSYLGIFSHIYFVAYLEPCVTLAYSECCHIQNPGIFRTQNIFTTLARHILAYSECCVTLAYWEPSHVQDFATFIILAYLGPKVCLESCLFRHIQTNSLKIVLTALPFFLSL